MDLEDPEKSGPHSRSVARIVFSFGLAAVILTGCSHDSGSRIHVELRDTPESKAAPRTDSKKYSCPDADGDTEDQPTSPDRHSVTLSWNLSTSSTGPDDGNILYCIYRSGKGPVQKNNAGSHPPCLNCQRVTKFAVKGTTTDPDRNVQNNARYCYVAVAIDTRNGTVSGFSNQAAAVIPPATDPPSCSLQNDTKQAHTKKDRRRR